jgi:hypothetical protein
MPYSVSRRGNKWVVYNPESGKVFGTHETREQAMAQVRALYANAPPEKESRPRMAVAKEKMK